MQSARHDLFLWDGVTHHKINFANTQVQIQHQ